MAVVIGGRERIRIRRVLHARWTIRGQLLFWRGIRQRRLAPTVLVGRDHAPERVQLLDFPDAVFLDVLVFIRGEPPGAGLAMHAHLREAPPAALRGPAV